MEEEDDLKATWIELGSTLIFFSSSGLSIRTVSYDPGNFGVLAKVHIGLEPSLTVAWLDEREIYHHRQRDTEQGLRLHRMVVAGPTLTRATRPFRHHPYGLQKYKVGHK